MRLPKLYGLARTARVETAPRNAAGKPSPWPPIHRALKRGDADALIRALDTAGAPPVAAVWELWLQYYRRQIFSDPRLTVPANAPIVAALVNRLPIEHRICNRDAVAEMLGGHAGYEIIEHMLKAGFPAVRGPGNSTWAALAQRKADIPVDQVVDLLVRHGANVDAEFKTGTALHYATQGPCENERQSLVFLQALLRRGANPNKTCRGFRGMRPIHNVGEASYVSYAWRERAMLLLLEHGADLYSPYPDAEDRPNQRSKTPLGGAIARGLGDSVLAYISVGADPRRQFADNTSSNLDFAAANSNGACIIALRATGAFSEAERRSALKIAQARHHRGVIEALQRPQHQLCRPGAGRTWLLSRIKDLYIKTRYGRERKRFDKFTTLPHPSDHASNVPNSPTSLGRLKALAAAKSRLLIRWT